MGWIIKMLLKVCKPFLKMMIWQAIFDYLGAPVETDEEPTSEDASEPASDPVD